MRVHNRWYSSMGTVPVAPRMKILVSDGDNKVSGFQDNRIALGSNNIDITYMPILIAMSVFTN